MPFPKSASDLRSAERVASRTFARWFPTPELLMPRAAGIDISDASIKWLSLAQNGASYRIDVYGEEPLAEGIVKNGIVLDVAALSQALGGLKQHLGKIAYAHAALPEEAAYVFSTHVPAGTSHEQTLRMIEFEFEGRVPIQPTSAVYDFDLIQRHDEEAGEEIGVSVFPRELAESYVDAFDAAGITLLSLEVEARSIARAVSGDSSDDPITLLVDFGRARTGFAVLKRGIPIFTSTVEVGGDAIERALLQKLSLSPEDAETFRNEKGLLPDTPKSAGTEAALGVAAMLADEIVRHYRYWDTRRNEHGDRVTPVGQVILVGGSANLKGLPDYIAGRVQAKTFCGDVWRHVADFDDYIPPIDWRRSLQYATAAGLALRSFLP